MADREHNDSSEKFVLVEYDRIASMQRTRLEFIENIFKAYLTLTAAIVTVIAVAIPKGGIIQDNSITPIILLGIILILGVLTFFRLVNCNIMLLELTNRMRLLRKYFRDISADINKYIPYELLDDEKKMSEWHMIPNISKRWLKGGHKGYQVIVALLNSICLTSIAILILQDFQHATSGIILYLAFGFVATGVALFLQILYVSKLYSNAHKRLEEGDLISFL